MNITLLMNETDSVQCHSVNVISDSIDDYTNLSNVQYIHKHNTSNNSSNNNTSSTINNHNMLITNHKSNSNSNTNELSTTDCTNLADNLVS